MSTKFWLVCMVMAAFSSILAAAESLDAVQQRMKTRLSTIEALKAQGVIGENQRGYVDFVGARKEKESEVQAENQDRKSVYEAIARKTGSSEEQVGRRRAQKIAESAPPGTWIQDAAGQWQQRK